MPEQSPVDVPIQMLDLDAQRRAIGPVMDQRIQRVLDHGKFIMGPEVQELEETLAARAGVSHVVACGNGTDALQLVLMAWEIGPGDAVFVPSFTFTATAEVVALLGATPVFCDVREDTYNLDATSLEVAVAAVITAGSLTPRVVIPVDLFGLPADYPSIHSVAQRYGLRVLADAAQSFGAHLEGQPVGSLAEATATSFFPAKPLGCYGDGGAVFTDDDGLADVLRSLRVHGKGTDKYDTVRIGVNSRLDTIQAAVLLAKLTVFDDEIAARERIAGRYSASFVELHGVELPPSDPSSWAQYTVRVAGNRRDDMAECLRRVGIPTAVYYPRALHDQPAYAGIGLQGAPSPRVSSAIADGVLSLPVHPYLNEEAVERVALAVSTASSDG